MGCFQDQCFHDPLQSYRDPDQDKGITENEMNEYKIAIPFFKKKRADPSVPSKLTSFHYILDLV